MILPDKNITLSNSLLGAGSLLLSSLSSPQTVSSLWEKIKNSMYINSFEKYVLTLDLLYMLGIITLHEGMVSKIKQ